MPNNFTQLSEKHRPLAKQSYCASFDNPTELLLMNFNMLSPITCGEG